QRGLCLAALEERIAQVHHRGRDRVEQRGGPARIQVEREVGGAGGGGRGGVDVLLRRLAEYRRERRAGRRIGDGERRPGWDPLPVDEVCAGERHVKFITEARGAA